MSQTLRARVLSVAVALVGEVGYARMTVKRVAALSGISQDTFHECFEDLDDCLLAAFEDALERMAGVVLLAYKAEREWPAKIRAAVAALLAAMEDEPALSTFVFVGALGAGPKVLACRLQALERLKIAFEDGIDDAGGVTGSVVAECSPLSAEGTVNGVLGILHTRLLAGSPLARRPLGELAGPLTAMIVLPYVGRAAAAQEVFAGRTSSSDATGALPATNASNGAGRPASKMRPKAGAPKRKRPRLTAKQRKLVVELKHGARTVRELVDVTGLSDQTARDVLKGLEARQKIVKTERAGRIAYALPSKGGAAGGPAAVARSSSSNGPGSSNGAAAFTSNGAAASNGHDRSAVTKAMLEGLETPISKRELEVLTAIGELKARGSSPSNREIGNATQIYDPTQLSKLMKRLAQLWLVENIAWIEGKQYVWRLTTKGTELLRELEGRAVGGAHPADARV